MKINEIYHIVENRLEFYENDEDRLFSKMLQSNKKFSRLYFYFNKIPFDMIYNKNICEEHIRKLTEIIKRYTKCEQCIIDINTGKYYTSNISNGLENYFLPLEEVFENDKNVFLDRLYFLLLRKFVDKNENNNSIKFIDSILKNNKILSFIDSLKFSLSTNKILFVNAFLKDNEMCILQYLFELYKEKKYIDMSHTIKDYLRVRRDIEDTRNNKCISNCQNCDRNVVCSQNIIIQKVNRKYVIDKKVLYTFIKRNVFYKDISKFLLQVDAIVDLDVLEDLSENEIQIIEEYIKHKKFINASGFYKLTDSKLLLIIKINKEILKVLDPFELNASINNEIIKMYGIESYKYYLFYKSLKEFRCNGIVKEYMNKNDIDMHILGYYNRFIMPNKYNIFSRTDRVRLLETICNSNNNEFSIKNLNIEKVLKDTKYIYNCHMNHCNDSYDNNLIHDVQLINKEIFNTVKYRNYSKYFDLFINPGRTIELLNYLKEGLDIKDIVEIISERVEYYVMNKIDSNVSECEILNEENNNDGIYLEDLIQYSKKFINIKEYFIYYEKNKNNTFVDPEVIISIEKIIIQYIDDNNIIEILTFGLNNNITTILSRLIEIDDKRIFLFLLNNNYYKYLGDYVYKNTNYIDEYKKYFQKKYKNIIFRIQCNNTNEKYSNNREILETGDNSTEIEEENLLLEDSSILTDDEKRNYYLTIINECKLFYNLNNKITKTFDEIKQIDVEDLDIEILLECTISNTSLMSNNVNTVYYNSLIRETEIKPYLFRNMDNIISNYNQLPSKDKIIDTIFQINLKDKFLSFALRKKIDCYLRNGEYRKSILKHLKYLFYDYTEIILKLMNNENKMICSESRKVINEFLQKNGISVDIDTLQKKTTFDFEYKISQELFFIYFYILEENINNLKNPNFDVEGYIDNLLNITNRRIFTSLLDKIFICLISLKNIKPIENILDYYKDYEDVVDECSKNKGTLTEDIKDYNTKINDVINYLLYNISNKSSKLLKIIIEKSCDSRVSSVIEYFKKYNNITHNKFNHSENNLDFHSHNNKNRNLNKSMSDSEFNSNLLFILYPISNRIKDIDIFSNAISSGIKNNDYTVYDIIRDMINNYYKDDNTTKLSNISFVKLLKIIVKNILNGNWMVKKELLKIIDIILKNNKEEKINNYTSIDINSTIYTNDTSNTIVEDDNVINKSNTIIKNDNVTDTSDNTYKMFIESIKNILSVVYILRYDENINIKNNSKDVWIENINNTQKCVKVILKNILININDRYIRCLEDLLEKYAIIIQNIIDNGNLDIDTSIIRCIYNFLSVKVEDKELMFVYAYNRREIDILRNIIKDKQFYKEIIKYLILNYKIKIKMI